MPKTLTYVRLQTDQIQSSLARSLVSDCMSYVRRNKLPEVDDIFLERVTLVGSRQQQVESCPEMKCLLRAANPGDHIVMARHDDMGNRLKDLIRLLNLVCITRKLYLHVVNFFDETFDSRDPACILMLEVAAAAHQWATTTTKLRPKAIRSQRPGFHDQNKKGILQSRRMRMPVKSTSGALITGWLVDVQAYIAAIREGRDVYNPRLTSPNSDLTKETDRTRWKVYEAWEALRKYHDIRI